jgi:hypothetical protein
MCPNSFQGFPFLVSDQVVAAGTEQGILCQLLQTPLVLNEAGMADKA